MQQVFPTVLIDSSTLFREGLAQLLAPTAFNLIASVPDATRVGDIVLDDSGSLLFLIGFTTNCTAAFGAAKSLKLRFPLAKIVLLGDNLQEEDLVASMEAGANSLSMKTLTSQMLIKLLDLTMQGRNIYFLNELGGSPSNYSGADRRSPNFVSTILSPAFSSRQAEILARLTVGESNKLIARGCNISEETVKVHIKAILQKIQVRNRTQAAMWAINQFPKPQLPKHDPHLS